MRARGTPLGYQEDCRLKGTVVDQEAMGAPISFDSHEWLRRQQEQIREQEYWIVDSREITGMIAAQVAVKGLVVD